MNPSHSQCQFSTGNSSIPNPTKMDASGLIAGIIVEGVLIFLFIVILVGLVWKIRAKSPFFSNGEGASSLVNSE